MRYRLRLLPLGLAAVFGLASPALGQAFRQVSLNTSTGQIDRRYLPSRDTFDILVRAASELREFRGEYHSDGTGPTLPHPWVRRDGTKSKDATLRIEGLSPGTTYQFTFVLVRRPSGNEGRLIEAGVLNALRDAFRAHPAEPIGVAVAAAAPGVKAALEAVLPRAVPAAGSPLSGDPGALQAALETRGVDVLHNDYLRELALVGTLRTDYRTARRPLARSAVLKRTLDNLAARLDRQGSFAELGPPLASCRQVRDSTAFSTPDSLQTDLDQVTLLASLKAYDATMGSCRGLLRDIRLPRYASLGAQPGSAVADLMIPTADRLEALRSETERLVALWRKRENSLGQVATDLRRTLDSGVTVSDTLKDSLATEPSLVVPPKTTLGLALAGTLAPCSVTTSCVRIVPAVALSFQLRGLVGAEVGLTLADTDAPGRTRHLFWSVAGMTGLTMRLGATRPQRVGIGALILRQAEGSNFDSFRLGGYFSFTVYDFRL